MPSQNSQQPAPEFSFPKPSESFGNVPNASEPFRTVPNLSERRENHTITVREAARMFEAAGVARTERSIVNWCQPNKMGVARLDCYFDPNERKYFISTQSIQLAISEEQAKAKGELQPALEPVPSIPKDAERSPERFDRETASSEINPDEIKELKQEIIDLRIVNKGKDLFIAQLQSDREAFNEERQGYVEKLMSFNRQVGELEAKLLQLEAPAELGSGDVYRGSDRKDSP